MDSSVLRDYKEIRPVGSGSFGKVLLVEDKESKKYVVKVIDISKMKPKEKKEALQESKLLSQLKHPYIVSHRDSWVENGILVIVMDYAENGDLCRAIQRQRKLGRHFSEQQLVRWFTQALLAIKHLHDRHILHRDIKSSNFFLTASGRLRAGDFGIAKVLENTAAVARTTIGTPYYLSPEICHEQPYSWASDMWALGVVLHEMCALRVPFDAANIHELVEKITREDPPPIPTHYTDELRQLVFSLLQKDSSVRPSAAEVLQLPLIQSEIRVMLKEEQDKKAKLRAQQTLQQTTTSQQQLSSTQQQQVYQSMPTSVPILPSPSRGDTAAEESEEEANGEEAPAIINTEAAALKYGHCDGVNIATPTYSADDVRISAVPLKSNPLDENKGGLYARQQQAVDF